MFLESLARYALDIFENVRLENEIYLQYPIEDSFWPEKKSLYISLSDIIIIVPYSTEYWSRLE